MREPVIAGNDRLPAAGEAVNLENLATVKG
jgi:hypothetical protein